MKKPNILDSPIFLEIMKNPEIILGTRSLCRFAGFLLGYCEASCPEDAAEVKYFHHQFTNWLSITHSVPEVLGWEKIIQAVNRDDRDSFDAYWVLIDEFINNKPQN
ncbi:hypothetical protein [uncultured Rubinisphaera sp.]|uniref:hypothetical protein n=1 Tax=uncultured Rubinisphaera sp. TaxID=1678686 RepID=UPI0030D99879|tara:strand:- start:555 stop:872 length:318 start_codon:yes stop_codon:yes gene_type:complete